MSILGTDLHSADHKSPSELDALTHQPLRKLTLLQSGIFMGSAKFLQGSAVRQRDSSACEIGLDVDKGEGVIKHHPVSIKAIQGTSTCKAP